MLPYHNLFQGKQTQRGADGCLHLCYFQSGCQEIKCCMVKYLSLAPCRALARAKFVFSFTVINPQCLPTEEVKHFVCVWVGPYSSHVVLLGIFCLPHNNPFTLQIWPVQAATFKAEKTEEQKFSTGLSMNRNLTQALKASQYQKTPC